MSSDIPEQCACGAFYLPQEYEDHMSLHADPGSLAPKTSPNDLKKIQLTKALHQEADHDSTDIALRSLLPDQLPQAEDSMRNVEAPEHEDNLINDTGAVAGSRKISSSALNRDRLDLSSKVAVTSLSKDELNKLAIEKQVELKQIKATVPKKEIHKYQNEPYSIKQIKDLGGCDKKVMGPREEAKNIGNQKKQVYSVINDSSRRHRSSQGTAVFVPITRKTNQPTDYTQKTQLDTRVNEGKHGQKPYTEDPQENERVNKSESQEDYNQQESRRSQQAYQPRRHNHSLQGMAIFVPITRKTNQPANYTQVGTRINEGKRNKKPYTEDPYENERVKKSEPQPRRSQQTYQPRRRHDHDHQCSDGHSFYCRNCGVTLPPQYRPFQEEDESPEMIDFSKKKIRQKRQSEGQKRGQCKVCQSMMGLQQEKYKEKR